jgi:UPF0716 family protein affecting phage T7 exclusion
MNLKRAWLVAVLLLTSIALTKAASAQCSICTKTAQQMGERPAQGMNAGILYLMAAPLAIMGFVGYRWWKNNRD